jgi:hypothetical protein
MEQRSWSDRDERSLRRMRFEYEPVLAGWQGRTTPAMPGRDWQPDAGVKLSILCRISLTSFWCETRTAAH